MQHMVVPVDREGKVGDCPLLRRDTASASIEPISSRKAGGRKESAKPHKVSYNLFSLSK